MTWNAVSIGADNAQCAATMHVQDGVVGHQSASFRVDTDIEMRDCLVCWDEALLS
jgi:hypothetical protein